MGEILQNRFHRTERLLPEITFQKGVKSPIGFQIPGFDEMYIHITDLRLGILIR